MPSRRIILLLIAVLAMLGARRAEGQSGTRSHTVARQTAVKAVSSSSPAVRLPALLPYMREPVQPLKGVFPGTPLSRRVSPRLVLPVGDQVQGSAGLVWSQRSLIGTIEVRLLLF
jgi:hypothetical protein